MASRIQAKSPAGDPAPDAPGGLPGAASGEPWPVVCDAVAGGCGRSGGGSAPFRRRVGQVRRRGPIGRIRDGSRGGKGGRFREDGRPGVSCRFRRGEGGRDRARVDSRGRQESEVDHPRGRLRGAGERDDHRRPDEEVQEEGCPCPLPGGSARPAPRHGDALLLPHHRSLLSRFLPDSLILFRGGGRAGAPRRGGRAPR